MRFCMQTDKVILLTADREFGRIAASYLAARFPNLTVIVETPISGMTLLKRRLRRLGPIQISGQLAFMLFQRVQRRWSRRRVAELMRDFGLQARWPDDCEILHVPSVNSPQCRSILAELAPRAVMVVGTRLIDGAVLKTIDAPFINYHAGITPKYRGAHGGYWAKAVGELENFGVTVHLVDTGIDTGSVIYQLRIKPSKQDNFSTYPYLQIAAALPLLERAARDVLAGSLKTQVVSLPSRIWSHPTIWWYLAAGLRRGAW
jgi:formyl transferase-like protein